MKNRKLFKLMMSALVLVAGTYANAESEGGSSPGGGSSVTAEIQRATDAFIKLVRENQNYFGIAANKFPDNSIQILVTDQLIKTCDGVGSLEAYSDQAKRHSVFNLTSWSQKDWIDKVHLAGHERLVVLGLEASNSYLISNKLYQLRAERLKDVQLNSIEEICKFDQTPNCYRAPAKFAKHTEDMISSYDNKEIDLTLFSFFLQGQVTDIKMQIRVFAAVSAMNGLKAKNLNRYVNSYSALFEPNLQRLRNKMNAIQSGAQSTASECVKLN